MATTASTGLTTVIVSEDGGRGTPGTPGADGSGFNQVRKSLLDSPLLHVLKTNTIATTSAPTNTDSDVTWARSTTGTFVDRYEITQTALANIPREEKQGFLIEGASTNLLLRSEDFLNSAWLQAIYNGGASDFWTLTAATADIKDIYGTNLASKFVATATSGVLFARQAGLTILTATDYTPSIWVYVPTQGGLTSFTINCDFDDSADSNSIVISEFDKWVRVSLPITTTSARTTTDYEIRPDGVTPLTGFICYSMAAQVEQLPFASSYIETVASTVTRTADFVTIPSLNNVPVTDMSVAFNYDLFGSLGTQVVYSYETTVTANNASFNTVGTATALFDGSLTDNINFAQSFRVTQNAVISTDSTETKAYQNGAITDTNLIKAQMIEFSSPLELGSTNGGSSTMYGHISDFRIYDFALNADEANYLSGV